jgi:regulatory protein
VPRSASKVERPSKSKRSADTGARARALRLLARRDYTRAELERKLAPLVEDPPELASLLDELAARGWLSDARVAEQYLHAKRGRYGAARLRRDPIAKGVPESLVAAALASSQEGELERAQSVWQRKFGSAPCTPADLARQVRFLQARGFAIDLALRVVRAASRNGSDC